MADLVFGETAFALWEPAREDNRTVDEDVNALASSRAGSLPQDLRQTCIGLLLEIRCGSELARDSGGSAK
ncbi:hypothetical protein [Pseudomonas sp. T1.Ur]|uniref:hypothetical protein n=1 Tax=Pseudomonas sp. T1.Ur TaxID=2928704 RepID=UPI00201E2BEC|nr:hypothetical protein [Pseudomonas sp. T1.Ur]MCL6704501.1 hypothetical protein [Pseudomonas sp. T1.Ur]